MSRRRSVAVFTSMALMVTAGGSIAYLNSRPASTPVAHTPQTSNAVRRDIVEVLSLDAETVGITATVPGASALVIHAPVEPVDLYDLVPAIETDAFTTKVSIEGRKGAFSCAALRIDDVAVAGIDPVSDQSDEPISGVSDVAPDSDPADTLYASSTSVRCEVPDDVTAYVGLETTVKIALVSEKGKKRTLTLLGTISSEISPSTMAHDHFEAVAGVDPALLYTLSPAISTGTARATGKVLGRGRDFECASIRVIGPVDGKAPVTVRESGEGAAPINASVGCVLPSEVEVYEGIKVSLAIVTSEALDVVAIPMTAVRLVDDTNGIVSVVTGRDKTGNPVTVSRAVGLGSDDGLAVEIIEGLAEGEEVLDPIS